MAFLDKLGGFAKSVGDKTGGMIEVTKLNMKINNENSKISEAQRQIGALCWEQFNQGKSFGVEVDAILQSIQESYKLIEDTQAEIKTIRESVAAAAPAAKGCVCAACGAANAEGTKFCSSCGAKIVEPELPGVNCQTCGNRNPVGTKFCPVCGAKAEEAPPAAEEAPQTVTCPVCQAECEPGVRFCPTCGHQF